MSIDTPRDDSKNAFLTRRGGGAAERAGLEDRSDGAGESAPNPTSQGTSDDPAEADVESLALGLRNDHELAEVTSVWKLLEEPIRQAILALVRVKPRG